MGGPSVMTKLRLPQRDSEHDLEHPLSSRGEGSYDGRVSPTALPNSPKPHSSGPASSLARWPLCRLVYYGAGGCMVVAVLLLLSLETSGAPEAPGPLNNGAGLMPDGRAGDVMADQRLPGANGLHTEQLRDLVQSLQGSKPMDGKQSRGTASPPSPSCVVVADMRNGRNSNQHLALSKAMGIAQALGCALQEPDFCVKPFEKGGGRLVSVQDTWNLSAVLPVVSLSSDATPLPAHKPSAINTKTDTKTDKVAGATVPAFRGVVPATNKAHAQPAASKNKGATQAERHLVTADVCLTTKKGMALTNKASSGCHLPFRCLYNYTMEDPKNRAHFMEQLTGFQSWLSTHEAKRGAKGDKPLVIGTLGIFSWGYLRMDYPPNDSVKEKAMRIIDQRLGGRQRYVSAHVRRGDFDRDCNKHKPTVNHPCGLDMARVPEVLAEAILGVQKGEQHKSRLASGIKGGAKAAKKDAETVLFIATDARKAEVEALKEQVSRLVGPHAVKLMVGLEGEVQGVSEFERIAVEQMLLGCGDYYLTTPGSSFSKRGAELGRAISCVPREVAHLPITGDEV